MSGASTPRSKSTGLSDRALCGPQQALLEFVQTLRLLRQLGRGADQGGAAHEPSQPLAAMLEPAQHRAVQARSQMRDARGPFATVGHDDFGSRGRCRCAHIGRIVGDGDVDLMADTGDDGNA